MYNMKKFDINNLKIEINKKFNENNRVPIDTFLSSYILLFKQNNELVIVIKTLNNLYANHSYKSLEEYTILSKNNKLHFEKVGYLNYRTKEDYIKITQIEIENDKDKNKGYGTMLLKSFEYFEAKYSHKKIKVIGSFAPKHKEDSEKTKHFYNKNGYSVKKELFSKSTIIKKVLDPKKIPYCKVVNGLNFIENSKENELSL